MLGDGGTMLGALGTPASGPKTDAGEIGVGGDTLGTVMSPLIGGTLRFELGIEFEGGVTGMDGPEIVRGVGVSVPPVVGKAGPETGVTAFVCGRT